MHGGIYILKSAFEIRRCKVGSVKFTIEIRTVENLKCTV